MKKKKNNNISVQKNETGNKKENGEKIKVNLRRKSPKNRKNRNKKLGKFKIA